MRHHFRSHPSTLPHMLSSLPLKLAAAVSISFILSSQRAAAQPAAKPREPTNSELLPLDARRWSQHDRAVMLTDLSQAQPASALIKGRREKGKWKTLPFATESFQGWALSTYSFTGAPVLSVPLNTKGWHAVHLGVCTVSTGFREAKNGLKAKLSGETIFKRMANNLALLPNRVDLIQDEFLTVAKLDGQSLEISPLPNLPATVCYVKLVPLTDAEVAAWQERNAAARKAPRPNIATFDGHSWMWPYEPRTKEHLLEAFRGMEHADIGKWWFQVLGADLVIYPTKVGTIPGANTLDFPTREHASFVHSLKELHNAGINPFQTAREAAREMGIEFHVMLRPAGWKAALPYEETFDSAFYEAHPEWRCVDRDGSATMHMSHAVPEVRAHLLDILKETLVLQPEGVGLLFNRGMPLMLWEDAFRNRYREMHNAEARDAEEEDPRIQATRAAIMTDFLRQIRSLLDETARAQGRTERYKISLGTFSTEADNKRWGLDLPLWIKEGLVDDLGIAWFSHHTSFAQPDVAYYKRITAGTKVGVYPFVIAWKSGQPREFCKKVDTFYKQGATGIAIWDPSVEVGWTEKPHGNFFDTLSLLSNRDVIPRWSAKGVPLPLSIPLKRLGENEYSRFFPTTGF